MSNKAVDIIDVETSPSQALTVVNSLAKVTSLIEQKDIDPAKLHSLLDFQERLMKTQAEIDFNAAITRLQIAMPRIAKNGEIRNKSGVVVARFMKYEDIDEVLRPLMAKEGFALQHTRTEANGKMVITTTLRHIGGHKETVSIPLPYDQPNALKNAVQAAVSTFSYGKRVNVCSLFNIVAEDEDDDGQKSEAVMISDDQAQEINDTLRDEKATPKEKATFLDYMGVDCVEDISLKDHDRAIMAINVWKNKKSDARAAKGGAA